MLLASPKTVVRLALALGAFALVALASVPAAPRSAADGGVVAWDDVALDDKGEDGVDIVDAVPLQPFADGDVSKPPDGGADDISPAMLGGDKGAQVYPNLEASLDGVAAASGEGAGLFGSADAAADFPPSDDDSATDVSVYAASDISDAKAFLERHGVPIDYSGAAWLEASVPARLLGALSERADVIRVETIIPPVADQSTPPPSPTPEPCVFNRGILSVGAAQSEERISGTWVAACESNARAPSYARFYTFRLSANAEVTIDLVTPDTTDPDGRSTKVDPYLFLRSGQSTSGTHIEFNDDRRTNPRERDSRITRTLPAGTYTAEATTYYVRETGSFTLTISYAASRGDCDPTRWGDMSFASASRSANDVDWPTDCVSAASAGSQAAYYTFSSLVTEFVEISLTSSAAGADPLLYLREGTRTDGAYIASDDDGGTGSAALIKRELSPGTYTIEATSQTAAATGTFSLSIKFSCNPNLGTLAATKTVNASWLTRCESGTRDGSYARFYTFTLDAGQRVDISLSSYYSSGFLDPYLYLREGTARAGAHIDRNDDSGGSRNSFIRRTLPAGTYTVEATTYSRRQGGGRPFSLTIGIKADCAITAALGALTAAVPSTGAWASDCESAARHGRYARYYTFSLSSAAFVEIDLQSAAANPYLYLRAGDGTQAGKLIASDNDGGDGTSARIARRLSAGATYTIEATTVDAAKSGAFTLKLTPTIIALCAATPLTLTDGSDTSPPSQAWESACHSARNLRGYAKHYALTLAASKLVTIELDSTVADTQLYLIRGDSPLGEVFAAGEPPAHDGLPTRASRIERILGAGDYTIEATAAKPGVTGAFTLTVTPAAITARTALATNACRKDFGAVSAGSDAIDSWTWSASCRATSGNANNSYIFTLAGNTVVTMDLFPDDMGADAIIELWEQRAGWTSSSPAGTRWEHVSDARGKGAVRRVDTLEAGTYLAVTLPDPKTGTGGFSFRARGSAPPSTLTISRGPWIPIDPQPTTAAPTVINGTWTAMSYHSASRAGSYASAYSFTLPQPPGLPVYYNVTIDLTSSVDTYMYLRGGGSRNRYTIEDDDDGDGTNSKITAPLVSSSGGFHVVEATTDERGRTGAFTLRITVSPIAPTVAGTSCDPEDMGEIRGRATRDGAWADDCDSGRFIFRVSRLPIKSQFYTFTLAERSFITLDASGPGVDTVIALRTPTGEPDDTIAVDGGGGDGLYSRIRGFLNAGTYAAEIGEGRRSPTRAFTFTVSAAPLAFAPGCDTALGTITRAHGSVVRVGAWAAGCDSGNRAGAYARRYAFTLENPARVNISTQARVASHLYIKLAGASENVAHLDARSQLARLAKPAVSSGGELRRGSGAGNPRDRRRIRHRRKRGRPAVGRAVRPQHRRVERDGIHGRGRQGGRDRRRLQELRRSGWGGSPRARRRKLRRRSAERLPERRRVGQRARRRRLRGDSRRRARRGAVSVQVRVVQRRAERGGGLDDGAGRGRHKHVAKLPLGRAAGRLFAIRERRGQAD